MKFASVAGINLPGYIASLSAQSIGLDPSCARQRCLTNSVRYLLLIGRGLVPKVRRLTTCASKSLRKEAVIAFLFWKRLLHDYLTNKPSGLFFNPALVALIVHVGFIIFLTPTDRAKPNAFACQMMRGH